MNVNDVQAKEFRLHLGEYLNRVHYQSKSLRLKRKNKTVAYIINENLMDSIAKIVDQTIEHQPALADSLALSLDDEIRTVIEQGTKELKAGKTLPIESILKDD